MAEVPILDSDVSRRDWSDAQRSAIVVELHRVVSHPTFRGSKRCITLLNYLVDRALAGEEDGIKERTLGIEVFRRDANYDTNADPIVRRTANEIRKRLGQCYFEPHVRPPVRIHMARGSYLLRFEFEGDDKFAEPIEVDGTEDAVSDPAESESLEESLETSTPQLAASAPSHEPDKPSPRFGRRGWIVGIVAALLTSIAGVLLVRFDGFSSPEYRLWKPLIDSGDRITLCISDITPVVGADGSINPQTPLVNPMSHGTPQKTPFLDTRVAQAVSMRLVEYKRQTNLQPSSALTFQDFRQQPAVLIGGTINPWATLLLSKLRYTLRIDPATLDKWIEDSQNPSLRDWKINGKPQSSDTFDDYAVITRFFDKDTGQWIMALSGLEAHGTEAAGQLVADPAFARFIPPDVRSTGNFQIVIKTPVLRGSTGPFEVLAVYTW